MTQNPTINHFIGKRLLLKIAHSRSSVFERATGVEEYRLLEISPSGSWCRLQNAYGNKFWRPIADIAIVEELKPLIAEPRPLG